MASHTVKSPAMQDIEIVDDDDWALTAGVAPRSLFQWSGSKPLVVRDLWEYGPVTDTGGGATQVLHDRIVAHSRGSIYRLGRPVSFTMLMSDRNNAAAFQRDVKGKRTFGISLVAMPEVWYRKLLNDIGGSMPTFTATPVNGTRILAPEPIEETPEPFYDAILDNPNIVLPIEPPEASPVIEVEIASQVAMELLTKVVEIIAAGSSTAADPELRRMRNELVHSQGLLAARLDENDRFRKQLRETGEELSAVKSERDGLRQRLRQTEANLNSALKGESAGAVTTEVMKRVDRIMRETPKPNRGDDS